MNLELAKIKGFSVERIDVEVEGEGGGQRWPRAENNGQVEPVKETLAGITFTMACIKTLLTLPCCFAGTQFVFQAHEQVPHIGDP